MSLADISRLVVFPGGTIPSGGVSAGDLAAAVATLDGRLDALEAPGNVGIADIADNAVTNAKLADMAEARIKGRAAGAGAGDPQDLTASQARAAMGLGTAATADADDFATASGLSDEITARQSADNLGDIIRLSSVTGTANAAAGTVQAAQAHIAITGRQRIQSLWPTTNTAANPTLTIGATAYTIKRRDGSALAAGDLRGGAVYDFVLDPDAVNTLRLMGAVAVGDITGLQAALDAKATVAALASEIDRAQDAEALVYGGVRPGDLPTAYGGSITGDIAGSTPYSAADVVVDADLGAAIAVSDAVYVAPRAPVAIEPGRVYQVRWEVKRLSDPADPNNDAVRVGLRWLSHTQAGLGSSVTVATISDLLVASGVYRNSVTASLDVTGTDYQIAAGANYARPWAQTFGDDHETAVGLVELEDITEAWLAQIAADAAQIAADAAQETADAASEDIAEEVADRRALIDQVSSRTTLAALVDQAGRLTDLELRRSDGRFSDRVVEGMAPRIKAALPPPAQSMQASDMSRIVGIGSSTIEWMADVLAPMAASLGADYYSVGDAGARSDAIIAAMAITPPVVRFPGDVIPATGYVDVSLTGVVARVEIMPFAVSVDGTGVTGTLSVPSNGVWRFTRAGGLRPVTLTGPVRLVALQGIEYGRAVWLCNIGKNDAIAAIPDWSASMLSANLAAWAAHGGYDKRMLVLGQFTAVSASHHAALAPGIDAVNGTLRARCGDHFFDWQGYLCSPGIWTDTGLTPTADDLAAQAAGRIPPSLAYDDIHLSGTAEIASAGAIKNHMLSLGWY